MKGLAAIIIGDGSGGETIKSISIFDSGESKEGKPFTFDGVGVTAAVPEPATWAILAIAAAESRMRLPYNCGRIEIVVFGAAFWLQALRLRIDSRNVKNDREDISSLDSRAAHLSNADCASGFAGK